VPAPPPHTPRANERNVLHKLTLTRGLSLQQLYPAGRLLIKSMVAKGWIEKQPDGRTYCTHRRANSDENHPGDLIAPLSIVPD
jgi:hypothetical protein